MQKSGSEIVASEPSFRSDARNRQVSHVLMSRPDFFAISESRNPLTRPSAVIDSALAHQQWLGLRDAFLRIGVDVLIIEPHAGLEDMCFAANQAFVGLDREERSFAIPSRMLHRTRRDEVDYFVHWYQQQGYRILDLELEGEEFLEGAGDLLWSTDASCVWAGYGHRSTAGAVDQFASLMEATGFGVRKLELVDPCFFHLNLCLAPLSPDAVLIYPGAFPPEARTAIRRQAQTYEVSREEALQFVCNGVAVNGYYITPILNSHLEQILLREGLIPLVVDLSEFHKAGGSAASLKMLLP